jgi:hypothetical protein
MQLEIPIFERKYVGNKQVVFFVVRLCCGRKKWNLEKRYNEFHDMNEALKNKHANMPAFPAKTYFSLSKDSDIHTRREGLNTYMKDLSNRLDMRTSSPFRSFL